MGVHWPYAGGPARAARTRLAACLAAAAACACLGLPAGVTAGPVTAFGPGERLEFVLKWAGIAAGDSVMEVELAEEGGAPLYRVVSTATSRSLVDVFYKVRNRYETLIDPRDGLTRRYVFRQDEGGKVKHRVLAFDQEARTVTQTVEEHGRSSSQTFEIPEGTQDNLSCLYALRGMNLEVGQTVSLRVFEGKRNWDVAVEVLAAEEVKVAAGRFSTLKVHPVLRFEGMFRRKGDLHVWVTEDPMHVPVLMKSRVSIGSIVAELVSYRLAGDEGASTSSEGR